MNKEVHKGIVGVCLGILLFVGVSYAYWIITKQQSESNIVNTSCFKLTFTETDAINMPKAYPLTDLEGLSTTPYTFTITNTCTATFDYQVNLESLEGTTLGEDYAKVSLNAETPVLLSGYKPAQTTIAGAISSRVLKTGSLRAGESVSYDLRLWIDYASTMEQSANKVFYSKIVVVHSIGVQNLEYKDSVIAAAPELYQGLLPVKFNGSAMQVADTSLSWYDYNQHEWANAVLVDFSNETIRNKYFNENMTRKREVEIDMNDVLQMYVWIPRYRYQLFNANNETSTPQAINIEFVTTDIVNPQGKLESEFNNGEWLVHPAFTFGEKELNGIWVGKFEMTGTSSAPTILPNQKSLTSLNIRNMFNTSYNIAALNAGKYGLEKDQVDTHMMKPGEWGAVAYLSNSIYGMYQDSSTCHNNAQTVSGGCEVWINPVNTGYGNLTSESGMVQYGPSITGCAGASVSSAQIAKSTACPEGKDWLQGGVNASTTGNITGVYDMSGGAWEYTMGVMFNSDNATPFYKSSGFMASTMPESKYYETYAYFDLNATAPVESGDEGNESTSTNGYMSDAETLARYHLGEGTREMLTRIAKNTNAGWYNDYNYVTDPSYPWVSRGGGYASGSTAGLFYFSRPTGGGSANASFRSVLSGEAF